jgi:hypothetical protein
MTSMLWDGSNPEDRISCPYSVDFVCKPAPAESLNSLESGRLLLTVNLGSGAEIKSATATIINNAKKENLGKTPQEESKLKYQTSLSVDLVPHNTQLGKWTGEIHLPSNWIEGGTRAYEKTGAAPPKSSKNLFTLEITYHLLNGNTCTARFGSEDAFHWQARPKAKM